MKILKLPLVLLLILTLLGSTWSKSIIYWAFQLNQEWISNNTCENRFVPEQHCKGHCQLNKQLKADEQQYPIPFQLQKEGLEVLTFQSFTLYFHPEMSLLPAQVKVCLTPDLSPGHRLKILHPPQALV